MAVDVIIIIKQRQQSLEYGINRDKHPRFTFSIRTTINQRHSTTNQSTTASQRSLKARNRTLEEKKTEKSKKLEDRIS